MENKTKKQQYLIQCQKDLAQAEKKGSPKEHSLALANYGYALSINNRRTEGMDYFDQAEVIAGTDVEDINVMAHGLGLRSLVYQESKRLPDAYQTSAKMLRLAREEGNTAIECDAVANQAQILLDSGEISGALRKFQEAETLAKVMGDDERLMRIKGALGNLSLHAPSLENAEEYYREALKLAEQIGHTEAEIGFKGNLGSVLAWQGKHAQALEIFEEILPYHQSREDRDQLIQLLQKMVRSYNSLQNNDQVFQHAFQAMEMLDDQKDQRVFDFLEPVILAYFREGKNQEANNMISEAITIARSLGDQEREVEFLMNLGESFVASAMNERALDIYQDALEITQEIHRPHYQTHIYGRMGFIYAEMGRLEEAVENHQQAIQLAQEQHQGPLEGNQRSMLALAYQELGQPQKAREQAQKALDIFQNTGKEQEAEKVQLLLDNLPAD